MQLKDWQIRSLKTFAQAFGGVFIPEVISILNNIESFSGIKAIAAVTFPAGCAAIAAGIAAVWNIILEKLNEEERKEDYGEDSD